MDSTCGQMDEQLDDWMAVWMDMLMDECAYTFSCLAFLGGVFEGVLIPRNSL